MDIFRAHISPKTRNETKRNQKPEEITKRNETKRNETPISTALIYTKRNETKLFLDCVASFSSWLDSVRILNIPPYPQTRHLYRINLPKILSRLYQMVEASKHLDRTNETKRSTIPYIQMKTKQNETKRKGPFRFVFREISRNIGGL